MFKSGSDIQLLVDGNGKRKFVTGKVVTFETTRLVVIFPPLAMPAIEQDVLLFADINSKFHQQGARVIELVVGPDGVTMTLEIVGKPVSAETRGSYRVSTITAELTVRIGGEGKCLLTDVSPEGWSAIVRRAPRLGSLVDASIQIEHECLDGSARVQSIKDLGGGRFRVGFHASETDKRMRGALGRLSAGAQRMQLRRMSRSA